MRYFYQCAMGCHQIRIAAAMTGLVIAIATLLGNNDSCAAREPDVVHSDPRRQLDAQKLVTSLINRNPIPVTIRNAPDEDVLFSQHYDWSEYNRVTKAICVLSDHGEEAWPVMVEHLTDKHYCTSLNFPCSSVDLSENKTVGDICREFILGWLGWGCGRHLTVGFGGVPAKFALGILEDGVVPRKNKPLQEWCRQRKDKKLYELQIEMCEGVISKIPQVPDLSNEERQLIGDSILADIRSLRKSRVAVRFPGLFWGSGGCRAFTKENAHMQKGE